MAVHFIHTPPKGLTPRQIEVYKLMKSGYRLFTTEGANYSVWLENQSGAKIALNRRTAESMANKNIIKPDTDHKNTSVFCWTLS